MSESDLTSEARAILFAIRGLRQQTAKLNTAQFPGNDPSPKKWLKVISGLLDTAEEQISSIENGTSKNTKQSLSEASLATGFAYQKLVVCEGVSATEIPYAVVPPLSRLLTRLGLVEKNDFFFRAKLEANYELKPYEEADFEGIRNKSVTLSAAIKDIRWPFTRITVPSQAFSILPHFAIVAHEMGHALLDKIRDQDKNYWESIYYPLADSGFITRVQARLEGSVPKEEIIEIAEPIFSNWFSEIASDAVGLLLMGPAFFFALGEFFLIAHSPFGVADTHPANDLRLRILCRKLHEGSPSFAQIFEDQSGRDITPDFNAATLKRNPSADELYQEIVKDAYDFKTKATGALIAELHTEIEKSVDDVYALTRRYVTEHAPEIIYSPEQYKKDIGTHLTPLLYAVPPIEEIDAVGKPVPTEFSTILNLGWIVLLCKLGEMKLGGEQQEPRRRVEILQGLVLKGVELAEARRQWDEA